jgi:hypothetical protein
MYLNLFGNTPEKDKTKTNKKNPKIKKLEKIIVKKNAKNLFQNLNVSNKSNSSLPDYSKVDQFRRSIKELNFYKKLKKEQMSDSIILELQKEINKEKLLSKNIKSEHKLKNIVKKKEFMLLPNESPAPVRLFPEKIKSKKTWTRPSSPNKRTLNFLQTYNKSAKNKLITNLKKNVIPYKGAFTVDNSSKKEQKKPNLQIFTSNKNIFGSESIAKKHKNKKHFNM